MYLSVQQRPGGGLLANSQSAATIKGTREHRMRLPANVGSACLTMREPGSRAWHTFFAEAAASNALECSSNADPSWLSRRCPLPSWLLAGCDEDRPPPARWSSVWGRRGISDGRLQKPRAMAIDGHDLLYIVDMTARIQVFTTDGAVRPRLANAGTRQRPTDRHRASTAAATCWWPTRITFGC